MTKAEIKAAYIFEAKRSEYETLRAFNNAVKAELTNDGESDSCDFTPKQWLNTAFFVNRKLIEAQEDGCGSDEHFSGFEFEEV